MGHESCRKAALPRIFAGFYDITFGLACRDEEYSPLRVLSQAGDRVLPAADLPTMLPHRDHLLGLLLDQPGGHTGPSHTG